MKRLVISGRAAAQKEADAGWILWEAEDTALPADSLRRARVGVRGLREQPPAQERAADSLRRAREDEEGARQEIEEAAIAWTKGWGKRPLHDGKSFRDLLAWKGTSLWWFAELYLHHGTSSPRFVRLIEVVHRLLDAHVPDEVEARDLPRADAVIIGRVCTARGVLFHGPRRAPAARGRLLRISLESRWNALKTALGAVKATLIGRSPAPTAGDPRRPALFLSHAAFWQGEREHYFDRLIPGVEADAALRPFVVAVGPAAAHRRRRLAQRLRDWLRLPKARPRYVPIGRYTTWRVWRETQRALRQVRQAWRELRRLPAAQQAFAHRGVGFFDLAEADLAGTMLLQLPWAVRSYEEMAEVLARVRPAVTCLYAESSGWGRAALAACRAAGIPSVAVQHGILYPTYYSYRHEPDEADCPRPLRTAVFGEAARRFLMERGHYPRESLVLTGSPKFDELLARAQAKDRTALRHRLGVAKGEALVAVASRYRPIRRTHRAIGPVFPQLVAAVESLPGVCALVKPHPAEPSEAYAADLDGARRVRLLPSGTELFDLLFAADALVTVESLSAVEALVLGRPVVVLNMPSNLRELVEAGVALGVPAGDDPASALRAALGDPETQQALARARERYVSDYALGVDGQATARILDLIRATAVIGSTP